MDNQHEKFRKFLRSKITELAEATIIDNQFLDQLLKAKMLTISGKEKILANTGSYDKASSFYLDEMLRRGPSTFQHIIQALKETEQHDLVKLLETEGFEFLPTSKSGSPDSEKSKASANRYVSATSSSTAPGTTFTTKMQSQGAQRNEKETTLRMSSHDIVGANGGNWDSTLSFTPDVQQPGSSPNKIDHDTLESYFNQVKGTDEQIEKVWIFKHNLVSWLPKLFGAWHEFTVVKSANWYWSFEKATEGICVQRSTDLDSVKLKYRGKDRDGTVVSEGREPKSGTTGDTIQHIFIWIKDEKYLIKGYDATKPNSHYFASLLYEAIMRHPNRKHLRT